MSSFQTKIPDAELQKPHINCEQYIYISGRAIIYAKDMQTEKLKRENVYTLYHQRDSMYRLKGLF